MIYQSMLASEDDKLIFTQIYQELRDACYSIALPITKNKAMAEDAVHNAFMSVIRHKGEIFELPASKRRTKILLIAKNKAIDIVRLEKRRTHEPISEAKEVAGNADVPAEIVRQEALEFLISCIASLPEKYKTVFELRYVHDLTNQEIAALIGISSKSVSTRLSRAKLMLQERYESMLRKK